MMCGCGQSGGVRPVMTQAYRPPRENVAPRVFYKPVMPKEKV